MRPQRKIHFRALEKFIRPDLAHHHQHSHPQQWISRRRKGTETQKTPIETRIRPLARRRLRGGVIGFEFPQASLQLL